MVAILGLVMPPWAKLAAVALLVAAVWGYGFACGTRHVEQRDELAAAKASEARDAEVSRLAKVRERIVYQYIPQVRTIEANAREIIREVPKYVTVEADRACTVPVGFRVLHDAAAAGKSLSESAAGANDAASGVALSAVAGTVADNYGTCNATRAQLIALQEWVRESSGGAP